METELLHYEINDQGFLYDWYGNREVMAAEAITLNKVYKTVIWQGLAVVQKTGFGT